MIKKTARCSAALLFFGSLFLTACGGGDDEKSVEDAVEDAGDAVEDAADDATGD